MMRLPAGLGRKCQYPLLFLFGSLPLLLTVFGAISPDNTWFAYILAGLYLLFAWLTLVLPGSLRILLGAAGALALVSVSLWSLPALLCAVFCTVLLFCSLRIGSWGAGVEVSLQGHLLGLAVHILCAVVPLFMGALGQQILSASATGRTLAFWGYSGLVMLSMNRESLFFAFKGKPQISRSMRRKNIVMVVAFFLLATLLAVVPAASGLLRRFLQRLYSLVVYEPDELLPVNPNATAPSGGGGGLEEAPFPEEMNSELEWLSILLAQIGSALVILAAVYIAGRELYKRLPQLRQWLARYTANISEDYTDEITDLRSQEEKENSLLQRVRQVLQEQREVDPTPQMRIRRRYRKLLRKHPQWQAGSTARENIPPEAARLYERARYSDHPVTQEDADCFRRETKKI